MTEQAQQAAPETVNIDSLDQFAFVISEWHKRKVTILEHFLSIPEGTTLEVNNEDIEVKDDLRKGFLLGLNLALNELGVLPFVSTPINQAESTTVNEQQVH